MEHSALRGKYSLTKHFLDEKQNNRKYVLYPKDSYVWFKTKKLGYQPAKVVEAIKCGIDQRNVDMGRVVLEQDGNLFLKTVSENEKRDLILMQEKYLEPEAVIDLRSIDLSSAAILHSLRHNFGNDNDYLQIGGRTLLYVNRFEDFEYILEKTERQQQRENVVREPNVEALAEECFSFLNKTSGKESQSCVFVGSVDAGRKAISQTFQRKLLQLSDSDGTITYDKLLAVDRLLYIFGGGRFIKWEELQFEYIKSGGSGDQKGRLVSGGYACFLFDTSSLTQNSRTFECFYQLCEAAQLQSSQSLREKCKLETASCYAFLNEDGLESPSVEIDVAVNEDDIAWEETKKFLKLFNVTDQHLDLIVQLLADILSLGNLNIFELNSLMNEKKSIDADIPGHLFGVKSKRLIKILANKALKVGQKTYFKELSKQNALQRRDGLARALYSGLFNLIVQMINSALSKSEPLTETHRIGIIASLETSGLVTELSDSSTNSLEQLIYNYAQERIFHYFEIKILKEYIARDWINDGVTLGFPESNASKCLPLLLDYSNFFSNNLTGANYSIISAIHLELRRPGGSDKKLITKLNELFGSGKSEKCTVMPEHKYFKVQHYCKNVLYKTNKFRRVKSTVLEYEVRQQIINATSEDFVASLLGIYSNFSHQMTLGKLASEKLTLVRNVEVNQKRNMAKRVISKLSFNLRESGYGSLQHGKLSFEHRGKSGAIKRRTTTLLSRLKNYLTDMPMEYDSEEEDEEDKSTRRKTTNLFTNLDKFLNSHNSALQKAEAGVDVDEEEYEAGSVVDLIEDDEAEDSTLFSQLANVLQQYSLVESESPARSDDEYDISSDEDDDFFEVTRNNIIELGDTAAATVKPQVKRRFSTTRRIRNTELEEILGWNHMDDFDIDTSLGFEIAGGAVNAKGSDSETPLELNSLVVEQSLSTMLKMLDATSPHFVFCLESNEDGMIEKGFDSNFVLSQLQNLGLQNAFDNHINRDSFGKGFNARVFLEIYKPLTYVLKKKERQNPEIICNKLVQLGLFPKNGFEIGNSGRMYIKSIYMNDLDTALSLATIDMATKIQSTWRRFPIRRKFLKDMNTHISLILKDAIVSRDKEQILVAIDMAERWKLAYGLMNIAKGKLKRIESDEIIRKRLVDAADAEDFMSLHEALKEAKRVDLHLCEELHYAVEVYSIIQDYHDDMDKAGEKEKKKGMDGVLSQLKGSKAFENRRKDVDDFAQRVSAMKEKVEDDEVKEQNRVAEEEMLSEVIRAEIEKENSVRRKTRISNRRKAIGIKRDKNTISAKDNRVTLKVVEMANTSETLPTDWEDVEPTSIQDEAYEIISEDDLDEGWDED